MSPTRVVKELATGKGGCSDTFPVFSTQKHSGSACHLLTMSRKEDSEDEKGDQNSIGD